MNRKICFITDAPPLADNAHGNHGIAKVFIKSLGDKLGLILTRKFRRYFTKESITKACPPTPIILYPDASHLGLRRYFPSLASFLDQILFGLWLPFFYLSMRRYRIERIFILCGADAWFLFTVRMILMTRIPVDIYLVDDMEAFSMTPSGSISPKLVKSMLSRVLHHCANVFAISQGFADYLSGTYSVHVKWLPIPSTESPPAVLQTNLPKTTNNNIVFIGALNHLYVDSLRDLYAAICEINNNRDDTNHIYFEIIGYGDPEPFLNSLPNRNYVINYLRLSDEERASHLSRSLACVLPYSFNHVERQMVSTSFSCKILEYYTSGRPILVYGPEYASIPRFFKDEGLPFCVTNRGLLNETLCKLEVCNVKEVKEAYFRVWEKYHSPSALTKFLNIIQ